jgi:hypothetical protein
MFLKTQACPVPAKPVQKHPLLRLAGQVGVGLRVPGDADGGQQLVCFIGWKKVQKLLPETVIWPKGEPRRNDSLHQHGPFFTNLHYQQAQGIVTALNALPQFSLLRFRVAPLETALSAARVLQCIRRDASRSGKLQQALFELRVLAEAPAELAAAYAAMVRLSDGSHSIVGPKVAFKDLGVLLTLTDID